MTDIETKQKIIDVARVLFANLGYEGTSVREIARQAEVNLALVNYYFSSKENLFQEILKEGYLECANQLRSMLENRQGDLEETLVDMFRYFIENSHDLMSHFKMVMSAQHSHKIMTEGTEDGMYGPPGGMVIAEVLKSIAPSATDEDIHWALKSLFSQVTHLSLVHSCCARNNKDIPFSSTEHLEKSIRRTTRIIISELIEPRHRPSNP